MIKRIYFLCSVLLLSVLVFSQENINRNPLFTIVLDAGHGGQDTGAEGKISKEKDINLAVALLVGKMIEENHPDTKVVFTRQNDVFVPLNKRANIANNARANLFVSIHTNAAQGKPTVSGAETYVLGSDKEEQNLGVAMRENSAILHEDDHQSKYLFDPNSIDSYIMLDFMQNLYMNQSINFAKMLQNQFQNQANRKDRGVRQAGFLVLLNTTMPSALVELGYISNPAEERYLNSQVGKKRLAQAIYDAFVEFKDEYVRKTYGEDFLFAANDNSATDNAAAVALKDSVALADNLAANVTMPTIPTVPAVPKDTVVSVPAVDVPVIALQPVAPIDTIVADTVFDKVVYKIQLFALSKKQPENSPAFKGLAKVGYYEEGGLFKYTYGESNSLREIQALQEAIKPQFPQTILVAFYQGKKITLPEAARIAKAQEKALQERAIRIKNMKAQAQVLPVSKPKRKPEIVALVTEQTVTVPDVPEKIPVVAPKPTSSKAVTTDTVATPVVPAAASTANAAAAASKANLSGGLASPRNTPAATENAPEARITSLNERLAAIEAATARLNSDRTAQAKPQSHQTSNDRIVYRLQILQSNVKFKESDNVFKGFAPIGMFGPVDIGYYKIYKYTYGESSNINDMEVLKQKMMPYFEAASIVAFDKQSGKSLSKSELMRMLRETND